ncbi:MAG: amidohydrolase family protein [Spirochaetaceae bacterium]|nr:amidohydrolase family protein [Spirochaetaceae bacterium]
MIIDVSNIIGRHKFKPEITAESLLTQMDAVGIDKAVISCYAECIDNESVSRAIKNYPDRFIGLYTVNPWSSRAAGELEEALTNKGFKGLYMNPLRHGYALCEHEVFYPLLDVCKKYDAVVWCLGAAEVFTSPVFFDAIAKDYPGVNIIMGRMGLQYDNASAVEIAKNHRNIYLDTSGSMDFNAHRAMKTSGIDKVLLGTGTPECGYFEFELMKVRNAAKAFPGGEAKVLYKNAARIFHLEVGSDDC